MADKTKIEWVRSPDGGPGATWNPITGCMVKSPGCINCYAMRLAGTRLRNHPSRTGLTREVNGHHVWTGEVRFNEQWLLQPLRWKRPRDIFVVAHGDLAYEKVPDDWLDRVFAVMILAKQHRFQILTKRPDRLLSYLNQGQSLYHRVLVAANALRNIWPGLTGVPIDDPALGSFHKNIWIGTSVERQPEADERRQHLEALARMGWNTWVSYEPALGPVDWPGWEFIKWMVSGGESGPGARPSHPKWHKNTRDWCATNSIPYFFKQWGSFVPSLSGQSLAVDGSSPGPDRWNDRDVVWMKDVGKKAAGALLDGVEHKAMPAAEVKFADGGA